MGCSREARESEKTFDKVWNRMRNLAICIWAGKYHLEDVKEYVEYTKQDLDLIIRQMEAENE